MIFKRKIYNQLLNWKKEVNGEKALLIEGARRIGKSTIVEEFAKNEYKSYILIDFSIVSNFIKEAFFNNLNNLDTFYMLLNAEYHTNLYNRKSLIIFDEIQKFPKAREAIKYLVNDGRYDFIETGSLISIKENVKNITIPSEERKIKMYPMDFGEFCDAIGEKQIYEYLRYCYEKMVPVDNGFHKRAIRLFYEYMLVGGMPKVVSKYIESGKNFKLADEEKRDIIGLYRDDILKISENYKTKVLSIFDQIPSFLSKHEKRVRINNIDNSSSPAYETTFFWLSESMIANECFNSEDPNVGLSLNEDRSFIKCYMGDTGLLISHTFDENQLISENLYLSILNGKLSINKGMFFENIVAQSLVANGHNPYFYTHYNAEKHRNDIEIDFIISSSGNKINNRIIPIEVKSSKNYTTTSLSLFKQKFKERIDKCYIIHPKNLMVKDEIIHLPAYMAGFV